MSLSMLQRHASYRQADTCQYSLPAGYLDQMLSRKGAQPMTGQGCERDQLLESGSMIQSSGLDVTGTLLSPCLLCTACLLLV